MPVSSRIPPSGHDPLCNGEFTDCGEFQPDRTSSQGRKCRSRRTLLRCFSDAVFPQVIQKATLRNRTRFHAPSIQQPSHESNRWERGRFLRFLGVFGHLTNVFLECSLVRPRRGLSLRSDSRFLVHPIVRPAVLLFELQFARPKRTRFPRPTSRAASACVPVRESSSPPRRRRRRPGGRVGFSGPARLGRRCRSSAGRDRAPTSATRAVPAIQFAVYRNRGD